MQTFEIGKLLAERDNKERAWMEFLRASSLSVGLYHLKAGQSDPQTPHREDEVYYVLSGKGYFRAGQEHQTVGPGTLIFVERSVEHRFYDIAEDLTVLVFFAPPEGSLGK